MTLEQLEQQAKELNDKIEAFKRQLEKPKEKAYTWEECYHNSIDRTAFIATGGSVIMVDINKYPCVENNKNISATEKVCKSHLAACKLSHIIEAINKDFEAHEPMSIYYDLSAVDRTAFYFSNTNCWALPYLNSESACDALIKTNTPLLLQYYGVEEK